VVNNEWHRPSFDEISVVIQGPLHRNHPDGDLAAICASSVRRVLPGAEIIISTWGGELVDGLDYDKLVVSKDPGPLVSSRLGISNVNRQAISTFAGLAQSTRPFVLKIRADLAIETDAMLGIRDSSTFPASWRVCKSKITITNLFVPSEDGRLLFHPSDIVQFGERSVLVDFWTGEYFSSNEIFGAKKLYIPKMLKPFVTAVSTRKYADEQALFIRFLNRHGFDISLPRAVHTTQNLSILSWNLLVSNFSVMDWEKSGILFPDRFEYDPYVVNSRIIKQQEFEKLVPIEPGSKEESVSPYSYFCRLVGGIRRLRPSNFVVLHIKEGISSLFSNLRL